MLEWIYAEIIRDDICIFKGVLRLFFLTHLLCVNDVVGNRRFEEFRLTGETQHDIYCLKQFLLRDEDNLCN